MYENNRYSNNSSSKYTKEGTWVYINGELYHAGVKGMHWYQHLPGTDWWKNVGKAAKTSYKESMDRNSPFVRDSKGNMVQKKSYLGAIKSAGAAAKTVGKMVLGRARGYLSNESRYYGNKLKTGAKNAYSSVKKGTSKLWNAGKGFSEQASARYKELAKKAYAYTKDAVIVYFNKSESRALDATQTSKDYNYLSKYISSGWKKANEAYVKALTSGKRMDMINSFIMSTGSNMVSGCAKFLDDIGLDDEVARFLKKFRH